MDPGIAAFRLLALSQVVLFAAATLSAHGPWLRRALLALLATTVAAYLLVPLAALCQWPLTLLALLGVLANLCPLALLLVVLDLFEEQVPGVPVGLLVGACALLAVLQVAGAHGPLATTLTLAGHAVKLALLACAAALLWRGRRVDLVEARLRLRSALVLVIGVAAFTVLAVELAFGWHVPAAVELPGMAAIFVLALAVNLAFWRFDSALAFENPVSASRLPANGTGSQVVATAATRSRRDIAATPEHGATDTADPLLASLDHLMRAERRYADHDLRIASLAARLGVPEYRVRRAINGGLGFRNFNQYVNSFRIDEASRRLRTERHLPVLSIALDVGFRSMSSFNVAFRERHGCAPGEFRSAPAPDF